MENIPSAEEIMRNNLEKESEEICKEVEADFEKATFLAEECKFRMFDNEIFIIDNKSINETNWIGAKESQKKIDECMEKKDGGWIDEDLFNLKIGIKSEYYCQDEEDGFTVYYPIFTNGGVPKNKLKIVTEVSSFIEDIIYTKSNPQHKLFYRGHGDWSFNLKPGIYRSGRERILSRESEFVREIISTYPQYFLNCKTALDFLAVLQHNGFPTRLLDFSENPLIALFMACSTEENVHADVMKLSIPNESFKYYDSDKVALLSNLAFFDDDYSIPKDITFDDFNELDNTMRFVHQIRNEKPYFEKKIKPEDLKKIIFVKPKQSFDRITHQSGLFALFGIDDKKEKMPTIEMMIPDCEITHYIVPASCKKKIMEELSFLNITRASVYCDLENISKYYIEKSQNNTIELIIEKEEKEKVEKDKEEFEKIFGSSE